jgi:predicted metal-dependent enzyme (double-stranded beta helix superfamily)
MVNRAKLDTTIRTRAEEPLPSVGATAKTAAALEGTSDRQVHGAELVSGNVVTGKPGIALDLKAPRRTPIARAVREALGRRETIEAPLLIAFGRPATDAVAAERSTKEIKAANRERLTQVINGLLEQYRAENVPPNELRVRVAEALPGILRAAAETGQPLVDPTVYRAPEGRRFVTETLFADEGEQPFRVVVFAFAPRKRTNVHSHTMQGVEITLEGTAQERRYLPAKPGAGGHPRARLYEIENREAFGWDYVARLGTDIHDVGNASKGPVVTMHVYFHKKSDGGIAADWLAIQPSIGETRAAKVRGARETAEAGVVPADTLLDRGLTLFAHLEEAQLAELGKHVSRLSGKGESALTSALASITGEPPPSATNVTIEQMTRLVFRAIGKAGIQPALDALGTAASAVPANGAPYSPLSHGADTPSVLMDAFAREVGL